MNSTFKPQAVGIPWIEEDEYPEVKTLMEDGHTMPDDYSAWKSSAERVERQFMKAGQQTIRVLIHPHEFRDWCAAKRMSPGSLARQLYSSQRAYEMLATGGKQ